MAKLGVYGANEAAQIIAFEKWLGRKVDFVMSVIGYANESDWLSSGQWQINSVWPSIAKDRAIYWNVPIIHKGTSMSAAAKGQLNGGYKRIAEMLAKYQPTGHIEVRTGWEFNGSWFFWNAIGKEADFVAAFRHLSSTFKQVSNRFQIEWCPNWGESLDLNKCYPGDQYVDVIGLDCYYKPEYDGTAAQAFARHRDHKWGMKWQVDKAKAAGKRLAMSEWGVKTDAASDYVNMMADWLESNGYSFHCYWNSDAAYQGKLSDNRWPKTAATFKKRFGGASTIPAPGNTPTPQPSQPETPAVPDTPELALLETIHTRAYDERVKNPSTPLAALEHIAWAARVKAGKIGGTAPDGQDPLPALLAIYRTDIGGYDAASKQMAAAWQAQAKALLVKAGLVTDAPAEEPPPETLPTTPEELAALRAKVASLSAELAAKDAALAAANKRLAAVMAALA